MFRRAHHQKIARILAALSPELLRGQRCYFAGGTAIALRFGEFRESLDIDFTISDVSCYRSLRSQIREQNNFSPLLKAGASLTLVADIRADQYGIRTKTLESGSIIKFEIILEGRINFDTPDSNDSVVGISCLTLVDLAATKILANSDRGLDAATHTRDIIDLAMMEQPLTVLQQALAKAEAAYGSSALNDLQKVLQMLENRPYLLEENMAKMAMEIPQALMWQKLKKLGNLTKSMVL